jgi:hypothetical protein
MALSRSAFVTAIAISGGNVMAEEIKKLIMKSLKK